MFGGAIMNKGIIGSHAEDDAELDTILVVQCDSLSADTVQGLQPEWEELLKLEHNVVLDLRQVDFIDSSGVGLIVFLLKRLQVQHRELKLVRVSGQPAQLLKTLGLSFLLKSGAAR